MSSAGSTGVKLDHEALIRPEPDKIVDILNTVQIRRIHDRVDGNPMVALVESSKLSVRAITPQCGGAERRSCEDAERQSKHGEPCCFR